MSLESRDPLDAGSEQRSGNIYDRLEAARRKRERILRTPYPANDDHKAPAARPVSETFPALKPPRDVTPSTTGAPQWSRAVPWLLGALIFAVIFAFAVG